jgi:hypothetical protein
MKRKQHHTPIRPQWSLSRFRIWIEIKCRSCGGWHELETLLRILFQNLTVRGRL